MAGEKTEIVTQSVTSSLENFWNLYRTFEVLTAVVLKSTVFWDITPCSPLIVN
jgi:hypothetical protein